NIWSITENENIQNKTTLNLSWKNSTQEVKSRIDQIWVSDNLAEQLFCADSIPSDLESHRDHACAIVEIEDNILKYTKFIADSDNILNKIEFNFKGTSEKKWKKFKLKIELIKAENTIFG
ncbi:3914_t:CDS:1, partial [Diversispora eburnea]